MKFKALILMLICTLFVSAAQLLYKSGATRLDLNVLNLLTNWPLILGLLSYGIALIFMILAYRHGELTFLYPILATTYIWVLFLSPLFFNDEFITNSNVIGVFLIVIGIVFIGVGSE